MSFAIAIAVAIAVAAAAAAGVVVVVAVAVAVAVAAAVAVAVAAAAVAVAAASSFVCGSSIRSSNYTTFCLYLDASIGPGQSWSLLLLLAQKLTLKFGSPTAASS